MTDRIVGPALRVILEAVDGIETATLGKSFDEYCHDWLLRHGVQRGIEIISEATRRIPPELQATRPEIPWPQIAGIGNVLRHEYHRVSDTVVWNVITHHLPRLKAAILAIEAELPKE